MNTGTVLEWSDLHFGIEFFSSYIAEHYGGEEARKNKGGMFLSVGLKVFIPQAICPVAKNLEENLELHENNLCKRAMTRYSRYSTKKCESIENKGKVATG